MSGAIEKDLKSLLGPGAVLGGSEERKAYSYDAGIYRVDPSVVVLPSSSDDAARAMAYCLERDLPVTFRSAGTNLVGGSIGPGVVMGMARMKDMHLGLAREGVVDVEPGVILRELNDRLKEVGMYFAPDPSSGLACQIGGMIGTNAAGAHALKYGATKENVLALDFLTADGERTTLKPMPLPGGIGEPGFLKGLPNGFRKLASVLPDWAPVLKDRAKHVSKNSSGYNLFDLAFKLFPDAPGAVPVWDPIRPVVGSEGTLGLVTRAFLMVRPIPARKITVLAFFLGLDDLGEAVSLIGPLGPSALEMMDRCTLDLIGRDRFGIPHDADSMLLIEFDSEPQEELLSGTLEILARYPSPESPKVAVSKTEQEKLWSARHALFPTLYRYDGIRRPINFADDVAVPVHRLTELLGFLRSYFKDLSVPVAIYGHIGNGNAHINPLLDLRDPEATSMLLGISRTIHREVIERFDGVPCGEHGEGRVRAEYLPEVYGPDVYRMFVETKGFFDPKGLLNPGVKISRASFIDNIDSDRVAKPCATCGKCNTVCPSFDVHRNEAMGARGWYQILTDPAFSGNPPDSVLDGCLNCKSCRAVCPAGVDVSAVVLEARSRFRADPLTRRIARILLDTDRLESVASWMGRTQAIWDRPLPRAIIEWASRRILGVVSKSARIPADLTLPRIRKTPLRLSFRTLTEEAGREGSLAYFHGCAANTLDDGVGEAMVRLLSQAPGRLVLPVQTCSGTPIETYGHKDLVREAAKRNLDSLHRYPVIVTGCASCTLALKDLPVHFEHGTPDRERAREVAGRVRHIAQFLLEPGMEELRERFRSGAIRQKTLDRVTYHASCHLRAAGVVDEPHTLLETVFGDRFRPMTDEDRCAGGAGTFLLKDPQVSKDVFGRKARAVSECGAKSVTTSCPACQATLKDRLGPKSDVRHLAILLADLLGDAETDSRAE